MKLPKPAPPAERKMHYSEFHRRDPACKPDREANKAVIRELKVGDRVDVLLEMFSTRFGYSYRTYRAIEVTWVFNRGGHASARASTSSISSNRGMLWLDSSRVSRIIKNTEEATK